MINIEELINELQVKSYILDRNDNIEMTILDRVPQMDDIDKWAIRKSGRCLNSMGEWEFEPMPTSRDDNFLQRCRFKTPYHAFAIWDRMHNNANSGEFEDAR